MAGRAPVEAGESLRPLHGKHRQQQEAGRIAGDVGVVCYVVLWPQETPLPALSLSRASPVHNCPGAGPDGARIVR